MCVFHKVIPNITISHTIGAKEISDLVQDCPKWARQSFQNIAKIILRDYNRKINYEIEI